MQLRKQQLELDMEEQTGSQSGKEYVKAVYCHPAYLTYMQIQFSSVAQSCPILCDPMDCSTPGFSVQFSEPAQTHVHQDGDAFQPAHSLSSLFPPAFNLSQH